MLRPISLRARCIPPTQFRSVSLLRQQGNKLNARIEFDASMAGNGTTTIAFSEMGLSRESMRAIDKELGFTHATAVQHLTLPYIKKGVDVLARAKTGSGKTLGFTLPSIELLRSLSKQPSRGQVSALIISPTRELASQIKAEVDQLLMFQDYECQVMYGGTNIRRDLPAAKRCDFLVTTPGRLIDHLQNGTLHKRLSDLKVLVLDEADQLLEMGFRPSIEKILPFLPDSRQTLLFSATVPESVEQVAANAVSSNHVYLDCVGDGAPATNEQVVQRLRVAPLEEHLPLLLEAIEAHISETPNHKIMCFFPTARATGLAAEVFKNLKMPGSVIGIHSRLSQSARTKAADAFRASKAAVMMSSDVTARGMDFPDVTCVIQVGVPSTREQYIHRLGRTGRAGKSGEGLLILADFETYFLRNLEDLPLVKESLREIAPESTKRVNESLATISTTTKAQAYVAWMGFYNSATSKMKWSKEDLVQNANCYALGALGCHELPGVLKKTAGMMGLKNVKGLNIVAHQEPAAGKIPAVAKEKREVRGQRGQRQVKSRRAQ